MLIDKQSESTEVAVDWLYCAVMGLVEGLTEFLPISSTGHLHLVGELVFDRSDPSFELGIQLGAITAILVLYRGRLWDAARSVVGGPSSTPQGPTNLLWLMLVAAMPAAAIGLLCRDVIFDLLYNPMTVAITLMVGGVLLWMLEAWLDRLGDTHPDKDLTDMGLRDALVIGLFQSLALIPGTSRSGAMIAGGLLVGCKRTSAAEFSFLVGLPVLYGASCLKVVENHQAYGQPVQMLELLTAGLTAFLSALVVVRPFVRFLQRHTFRPFAWYRIALGGALLALVLAGLV